MLRESPVSSLRVSSVAFFSEVPVERPETPLPGLPLKAGVEVSVPPCLNCPPNRLLDALQLGFEMVLLADSFKVKLA